MSIIESAQKLQSVLCGDASTQKRSTRFMFMQMLVQCDLLCDISNQQPYIDQVIKLRSSLDRSSRLRTLVDALLSHSDIGWEALAFLACLSPINLQDINSEQFFSKDFDIVLSNGTIPKEPVQRTFAKSFPLTSKQPEHERVPFTSPVLSNVSRESFGDFPVQALFSQLHPDDYYAFYVQQFLTPSKLHVEFLKWDEFVKQAPHALLALPSRLLVFDSARSSFVRPSIFAIERLASAECTMACVELLGTCAILLSELQTFVDRKHETQDCVFRIFFESVESYAFEVLSEVTVAFESLPADSFVKLVAFCDRLHCRLRRSLELCRTCSNQKDAASLLNTLLFYAMHCSRECDISKRLLIACFESYSRLLERWVTSGRLPPVSTPFFIHVNPQYVVRRDRSFWSQAYTFSPSQVPNVLPTSLAKQLLLAGKTAQLHRMDATGVLPDVATGTPLVQPTANGLMTTTVELSREHITDQAVLIDVELASQLETRFGASIEQLNVVGLQYYAKTAETFEHLENLRATFLFGDGEFADNLSNVLFAPLSSDASSTVYTHCDVAEILSASRLDTALARAIDQRFSISSRSSLMSLLSFRVLDHVLRDMRLSSNENDVVVQRAVALRETRFWNCLEMHYSLPFPASLLLPDSVLYKYNRLFQFLLTLDYLRWCLRDVLLIRSEIHNRGDVSGIQLRLIDCGRHEMQHFVHSLQSYVLRRIHTDPHILREASQLSSIDDLLSKHSDYLQRCITACALDMRAVQEHMQVLFAIILKFRVDLCLVRSGEEVAQSVFKRLKKRREAFRSAVVFLHTVAQKLVSKPGQQQSTTACLKEFLLQLNFNEYYGRSVLTNT